MFAILKYQQKNIMERMQTQNLILHRKEAAITVIWISNYMTHMLELEKKYGDTIYRDTIEYHTTLN